MADEKILISIEIEKGQNEAEVDNLTKKITNLQAANHNLAKEQQELIKQGKQNSEQYVENSRQIEINKQKINESVSSRKNLITSLVNEDTSIKALNARNAELIKQRNLLSTSTEQGRAAIAEINQELDRNNKTIVENSSALEKQRFNIGNYKSALDGLVPGLGGMVTGIQASTKAAYAFIATGIGAIIAAVGLAVFALMSYFKSSEAGQNRWNKIVAIGSAILEQFMNVIEKVGEVIFDAFANPQEAMESFVGFLKEQIINRFNGLLELIPELGKAIKLLFEGEFAEAGQVAGDAVGKVTLGIEDATEKVKGFIQETAALVEQGIANGEKLAALQAKIDTEERKLIVDREKTNLEVAKLRAEALKFEGEERKKRIEEAVKAEEELSAREVKLAKTRLELAKATLEANGDDKEALTAVAEARAAVFAAEATAFQNTLRLKKEVRALDEEEQKEREKAAAAAIKLAQDQAKEIAEAEKEQFENNLKAIEEHGQEKINKLKEQYEQELITKDEFEKQFAEVELEALIARRDFLLLNQEETLTAETAIIDKRLAIKLAADAKEKKSEDDKLKYKKTALENEKAITNAEIGLLGQFGAALQTFAGKNKALAIAGIIIQKVAAIAQIIANTAIANAKAVASFWITGGLPWTAINTAVAAISIASVIAEASQSISAVNSARRGALLKRFGNGGLPRSGGILRGPRHERGGIPFRVGGQSGFEAEGGEAIINRRSTALYKKELSAINQAGGGVPFATGGVIGGTQTRQAAAQAQDRDQMQQAVENVMRNFPPIVVYADDISAKQGENTTTQLKAQVI